MPLNTFFGLAASDSDC